MSAIFNLMSVTELSPSGTRVGIERNAFRKTELNVSYLHSISGPELTEGVPVDMKSRKKVDATAA